MSVCDLQTGMQLKVCDKPLSQKGKLIALEDAAIPGIIFYFFKAGRGILNLIQ